MRKIWPMRKSLILAALLVATPILAQDEPGFFGRLFGSDSAESDEDQGGILERLIEDNLSGEGRNVSITGFQGALSGRAQLDTMTFADADGVWLTLSDVVLDWNRSALFRGRLEVTELSAGEILVPRLPAPAENAAPTPEASGFSLPELPVAIVIDKIEAARVVLGEPLIGAEIEASVAGAFRLEDGEGSADLSIERLDGEGALTLDAAYVNATNILSLDLSLQEGPDGILARMIDLPGRPALDFSISGEAPIDAYAANIRLATDGQERLSGTITTDTPDGAEDGTLRIVADINGDIAPVFAPDYQPFFGPDVGLSVIVTTFPDGRLLLDDLEISSRALNLTGNAAIGSDGLPDKIALDGRIFTTDGDPVLLPLSGPETKVDSVTLDVKFDADRGDTWTGQFLIEGLNRPGFSAEALTLSGEGQITPGTAPRVTAALNFDATRLDLGDPNATEALGETVTGALDIDWTSGGPIRLSELSIDGESYGLTGNADIAFGESGPAINGRADVRADRLSVFSGLAGRALGGSASLATRFETEPLAGLFDVTASGTTENLIVSQPEADRILQGTARLEISAARDETGLRITLDRLESPNASLKGQAALKTGASSASLSGSLVDAALILPQVSGPVRITASAEEANGLWNWRVDGGLEGTELKAEGTAADIFGTPVIAASGTLSADDLSDFATLANRPLSGSVLTDFSGEVVVDLSRADITLNGTGTGITVGQQQADSLLEGPVRFSINASMAGDVYTLRQSSVEGRGLELAADAILSPEASTFDMSGRIDDASRLLPGAPAAPLTFAANGKQDGRDWTFDTSANGPDIALSAQGVALDPYGNLVIDGSLNASLGDLSLFSDLAGRSLAGQIDVDASGKVAADLATLDVTATASGSGISIGQAEADRLLAGDLNISVAARREGDVIDIDTLTLTTGLLDISASGALGSNGSQIALDARLADIAAFVDGFAGPLAVSGTVGQQADKRYILDLAATGPGGAQANVSGTTAADFATVDLSITGGAPLGLVNRFIVPRSIAGDARFDLSVNGPPALSSVSGRITSNDARLVAPTLGFTLENIDIDAALSSGTAQLNLSTSVQGGGRVIVSGPLALSAPFNANLAIQLQSVVLTDPQLYETTVNGTVNVNGALTGGARVTGNLALGETNIRIPSSGLGGSGDVPEILHINEPPPVRGTRRRAGLLDVSNDDDRGPGFPLDIAISAPNRIFIRGRGLDAEFGGDLRITGSSNDIIPIGAFNLIRGRLDILGQRLAIEEATASLQGSFVPVVRIRATTQTDEYNIGVIVAGRVSDPEITFVSEPDLPEEEVLARLLFGRGLDTLSPIQAARLALAVRTLAGRGGEGVLDKVRSGVGLADFDVTTDEEGNAAVRAGAYIGENLYTDVTVGADGETELNLNLDVSRSVTLKGSVSNEGDTSIGIFYERDY